MRRCEEETHVMQRAVVIKSTCVASFLLASTLVFPACDPMPTWFGLSSEDLTRQSFFDGLVVLMFSITFEIKLWKQFVNIVDSS